MAPLPPHLTGFARSGDVEIFYRRFGSPGRSPILIVHGLSYFSYDWIGVASQLGSDREVVAMDMRGFGQSSRSPARDYKLEAMSADVTAVLDTLGWDRAILMGHSFGGRVCLATAGWHAGRAAGLILVDFAPDIPPEGRRRVAERIGGQPDVFASVDAALAYEGYGDEPAGSARRARMEAFLAPVPGGFALRRDLAFRDNFKRALDAGQSPPVPAFLWTMLAELSVPALLVRGRDSDMLASETMTKVRAANSGIETGELAGGHDLAGDNPDGLVEVIRGFIGRHSALLG